jgi:hypothetical protein
LCKWPSHALACLLRQLRILFTRPAAEINARGVVLAHHGHSMMRELLWGHVTMHCSKFSQRPLVVLEPQHIGAAAK